MSQQAMEVARRAWTSYIEGGWDSAVNHFAEDCVVEDFPEMADGAAYEGRRGLIERDRHFRESWGDFAVEPVEFIAADDDIVIAVCALRVRGRGSGAPLDVRAAFVHDVRDGKIVRDRAYTSRADALEAVGLSE
jgi:ketosteroid isomerase-like protein